MCVYVCKAVVRNLHPLLISMNFMVILGFNDFFEQSFLVVEWLDSKHLYWLNKQELDAQV